jgi:alpha-aminoadipic semialdehyde synthase
MPPRHPARTLNARRAFSVSNITRPAATDSVRFVLGIRAEDPKRLWERRAPLLPAECATLLADASLRPLRILVQPSERRCVPDAAYRAVGVEVNEDLTECDAIVGVKEVPAEAILRDARSEERSYVVFNHVHKAQAYNMPLLASMLDSGSRFIGANGLAGPHTARR